MIFNDISFIINYYIIIITILLMILNREVLLSFSREKRTYRKGSGSTG